MTSVSDLSLTPAYSLLLLLSRSLSETARTDFKAKAVNRDLIVLTIMYPDSPSKVLPLTSIYFIPVSVPIYMESLHAVLGPNVMLCMLISVTLFCFFSPACE